MVQTTDMVYFKHLEEDKYLKCLGKSCRFITEGNCSGRSSLPLAHFCDNLQEKELITGDIFNHINNTVASSFRQVSLLYTVTASATHMLCCSFAITARFHFKILSGRHELKSVTSPDNESLPLC